MYKNIELLTTEGKKKYGMLANGATAIRYRQVFHSDLMGCIVNFANISTNPEKVDFELPGKMAYVMNAAAEGKQMDKLSEEDYCKWIEQFEGDTLWYAQDEISGVYLMNQKTTSEGKN